MFPTRADGAQKEERDRDESAQDAGSLSYFSAETDADLARSHLTVCDLTSLPWARVYVTSPTQKFRIKIQKSTWKARRTGKGQLLVDHF